MYPPWCSGDNHRNVIEQGLINDLILLQSSDSSLPLGFSEINIFLHCPDKQAQKIA